jgi:hypothetical protein
MPCLSQPPWLDRSNYTCEKNDDENTTTITTTTTTTTTTNNNNNNNNINDNINLPWLDFLVRFFEKHQAIFSLAFLDHVFLLAVNENLHGNCFWLHRLYILWRIDSLRGKNLERNETTAVAMQQHGKYASTTIELLLEMVICNPLQQLN